MKKLMLAMALAPLLAFAESSTPAGFTDNLDEALAAAKANSQKVLVCFSGSDWCGWCKRLEQEVFSKPEFVDAVKKDYQLVFIDSPRDTSVLSERAKVENPKIVRERKIYGFPTVLILDANGETVAKTGYREGGPAAYAKHILNYSDPAVAAKIAELEAEREQISQELRKRQEEELKKLQERFEEEFKTQIHRLEEIDKQLQAI